MLLTGQRRDSRLVTCLDAAPAFDLTHSHARSLIDHQYATLDNAWDEVCDAAGLSRAERETCWQRSFLNPYCLEGYPGG